MKVHVHCVLSLEYGSLTEAILESTHNISFSTQKKKITLNYSKSAAMGFFEGTQEQVRNSHGK